MSENLSNYFVPLLRARNWQHRPEFDQVCDWWRSGGQGVCSLVGMGGAGKTAIVARFLLTLPGVMHQKPTIPKDNTLPKPDRTFVFSFFDAPNTEAFFQSLKMWLVQSLDVDTVVSYSQLLFLMQNAGPGLIVLDGLEKMQEDGTRGIFGQLNAHNLRNFVKQAADGYFPKLSVLITTRFPLADLHEDKPDFFQAIPIEEIDIPTGINLLRQRGVQGNDLELERIVRKCGQHALTVDLVGGYIKEYGNGDSNEPLTLGTASELEDAVRQEQDPAKRSVLKQGFRFARVAQSYREAMQENDPAAIALLERICLFRLGVGAEILTTIFTGKDAVRVSGAALAELNAQQLQSKLRWLAKMRIIERSKVKSYKDGKIKTVYKIHPAVRDGFVQGIDPVTEYTSHLFIRRELEVSLGDIPSQNPSHPDTLDLLEEIIFHAIASREVYEAWTIYQFQIGAYGNLGWRLGFYERGERICRAFGGSSPELLTAWLQDPDHLELDELPFLDLPYQAQTAFICEWALYLTNLGRLNTAIHCYKINIERLVYQENWTNAVIYTQNLSELLLLTGHLKLLLSSASEAIHMADLDDLEKRKDASYTFQGTAYGLQGNCIKALEDFRKSRYWQNYADGEDNPLYGGRSIHLLLLLIRLGRHKQAKELAEASKKISTQEGFSFDISKCNLVLAELLHHRREVSAAQSCYQITENWALARDAKELLCWASLVKARLQLTDLSNQQSKFRIQVITRELDSIQGSITRGLKIARDCGYGLYHIDLMIEKSHLHLLQGSPQKALADLRLALDNGIHDNNNTGQPELLAATHQNCGYVWAIAEGLHRRAEAFLLQAAQLQGIDSFIPARRDQLPTEVQNLIAQAETCLTEAMNRWRDLRDPEVKESNFIHPETGEEYNYRAEETYQIVQDLAGGILTKYLLQPIFLSSVQTDTTPDQELLPIDSSLQPQTMTSTSPRVLISYSHDSEAHKARVLNLSNRLRADGIDCQIDQYIQHPPQGWPLWMDKQLEEADFVLVVFTEAYSTKVKQERKSGSRFEGSIILEDLYNSGLINEKFIPILFAPEDSKHILTWFKPYKYYTVDNDAGYESLRRRLLNDPEVIMPPLGIPIKKGPIDR